MIIYVRNPSTGQLEPLEVGGSADAVLYTEQALTDEQKAQARENIGAAAIGEGGGSGGVTDEHINSLIDAKLGQMPKLTLENGVLNIE